MASREVARILDFSNFIEEIRQQDIERFGGQRIQSARILPYEEAPESTPGNTQRKKDPPIKIVSFEDSTPRAHDISLESLLSQGHAEMRNRRIIHPAYTTNGQWDLPSIYKYDILIDNLVGKSGKNSTRDDLTFRFSRQKNAFGQFFEQIAYDLHGLPSMNENEIILGTETTKQFVHALFKGELTSYENSVIRTDSFSVPDFLSLENGRVNSVYEVTTTNEVHYFHDKIEKFDRTRGYATKTGLFADAQLKFLTMRDNSILKKNELWKQRPDIDIIPLPIETESLFRFFRHFQGRNPKRT